MLSRIPASARTLAPAALALSVFAGSPAYALEANAFAEALQSMTKRLGYDIQYGSASLDGSTVVLSDVSIGIVAMAAAGEDTRLSVQNDVRFENVAELGGGGYKVERVGRDNVGGTITGDDGVTVDYSIQSWAVEGLTIAGDGTDMDSTRARAGLIYDRASLERARIAVDGQEFMTMNNAQSLIEMNGDIANFNATMDQMVFDMTVPPDEALKEWVQGTGYDRITANYFAEGTWNVTTGQLDAPTNNLRFEGMGELNLNLALDGYTPAFVESLQSLTEQMNSGDENAQQAAGMQMLGLVSQLSFGRLVLSYRDGGMTNTLLEYYAKENGTTKEALIAQATGMMPIALAQIGVPELQAQIQEAAVNFMNDPKSLTIALEPDAPVAFPVIMGAAMSSPAELAKALNATVRANEAGMME